LRRPQQKRKYSLLLAAKRPILILGICVSSCSRIATLQHWCHCLLSLASPKVSSSVQILLVVRALHIASIGNLYHCSEPRPVLALSFSAIMRGGTLIQQHPPTPPSTGAEYQTGLQHIAQYNTGRGFAYGSPRSMVHEGIPSRGSHMVSHPSERLGLGIQYVRTSAIFASRRMLIEIQDGYGPANEYYHNGRYDGLLVSKDWRTLLSARELIHSRTNNRSSHPQLQGPLSMMISNEERRAVGGRAQLPVHRDDKKQALDQKRHQRPKKRRLRKETSPSLQS
jgi:hypothetical protein